jgi:hypothetical protein
VKCAAQELDTCIGGRAARARRTRVVRLAVRGWIEQPLGCEVTMSVQISSEWTGAPIDGVPEVQVLRAVMAQVASPVSVVTTTAHGRPHGATVSAFTSLSFEPPMLLVSLKRESQLLAAAILSPDSARASVGSRLYVTDPTHPTMSRPSEPAAIKRASRPASSTAARTARARSRYAAPASVNSIRRVVRRSSCTPRAVSRLRICCESGGCAMCSRAAARPKCRSSATATKYRSWRRSIDIAIVSIGHDTCTSSYQAPDLAS